VIRASHTTTRGLLALALLVAGEAAALPRAHGHLAAPPATAVLTLEDLGPIRQALVEELRRWRSPDAAWLLRMTAEAPYRIDDDGVARIALWLHSPRPGICAGPGAVSFLWRRAGTFGPAFCAVVERSGTGWRVESIGPVFIHPRNP
jgi:hypothetical protein